MKDMKLKRYSTIQLRIIIKEISGLLFSEVKDTITTPTSDCFVQILKEVREEIKTRPDRNVTSTFVEEEA